MRTVFNVLLQGTTLSARDKGSYCYCRACSIHRHINPHLPTPRTGWKVHTTTTKAPTTAARSQARRSQASGQQPSTTHRTRNGCLMAHAPLSEPTQSEQPQQ